VYKLFLTLRYLRKRRIAYFAVAAVSLCVAMVLVVMSVMGGWLEQVKTRARGLLGDVMVDNQQHAGFPLYQEFIDEVSRWPEIKRATPVVYSAGLMVVPLGGELSRSVYVNVAGIRLQDVYEVNAFKQGLFYEKWYPGTTSFAEAKVPKLGIDLDHPAWSFGDKEFHNLVPPSPFYEAWKKRIAEHRAATGKPLLDSDSVPGSYAALLRAAGRDDLPGLWELNEDQSEEAKLDPDQTHLLEPGWGDNDLPGAIIGRDIVAERQKDGRYRRYYPKGWTIRLNVVTVTIGGRVDPKPTIKSFRYVDDSRTGVYEIDSRHVYVEFELLQRLLEMQAVPRVDEDGKETGKMAPGRASQLQIKLQPGTDPYLISDRLTETYRSLAADPRFDLTKTERYLLSTIEAKPWQETQAHIIGPIQKEKMLVTILFGIISMVAVALILCILYMIVLQKTRDIGILKAVGGSSGGVAAIWVGYGLAVGVVGAILGTILGAVFVYNINNIQDLLIRLFDFRVWDMRVYSFDSIPQEVAPVDAAAIAMIAVAASTLGALGAARRAALMEPVESIRHE
jgi:lipoprotein-releasing system permease protein